MEYFVLKESCTKENDICHEETCRHRFCMWEDRDPGPPGTAGESFVTSLFTFCFISMHFQVEKETR